MAVTIHNLCNQDRKIIDQKENFKVIEYTRDLSVAPDNAATKYFMEKMGVTKKQLVIDLDQNHHAVIQAGTMQWTTGSVEATTGLKGVGDLFGKMIKGKVTKESAIKPEYVGNGSLVLEPTYKHIILIDVASWGKGGMTIEDGMFLASDARVKQNITMRNTLSSATLGNEGLFNLSLSGEGIVALESNMPYSELVEVELENDTIMIDGDYAVCWSTDLKFTVERSSKTLMGSAINGEGFVNVYRGTGRILMSLVTPSDNLYVATHNR